MNLEIHSQVHGFDVTIGTLWRLFLKAKLGVLFPREWRGLSGPRNCYQLLTD
jgi:hypothetical protein